MCGPSGSPQDGYLAIDPRIGITKQATLVLKTIRIRNYKSIEDVSLDLGRVNVLIGENGAGKSNVLEAIALAGAAEARKLDNEFLASRGIRVTDSELMRSAFTRKTISEPIIISVASDDGSKFEYTLNNDNEPYSEWSIHADISPRGAEPFVNVFMRQFTEYADRLPVEERLVFARKVRDQFDAAIHAIDASAPSEGHSPATIDIKLEAAEQFLKFPCDDLADFLIYSPENSSLRLFDREGQIEPLGVNGEGLFKLLSVMSQDKDRTSFEHVKSALHMLSWFKDFNVREDGPRRRLNLSDEFIDKSFTSVDQRSANEGFLFVTFYLALFSTRLTPKFFAIDNIDASLNPKLCEAMTRSISSLAKLGGKQCLLTTHNPSVLDGLDLTDPEQRLFVVSRNRSGKTRARRFVKGPPSGFPSRLSELFLRGTVGGLPKTF
jgi:predicted ATPase